MQEHKYAGLFYNNGKFSNVTDHLAEEVSLTISVNDVPFTVTMRTPGHENELVRGLLFSEEIYGELNTEPIIEITDRNDEGVITALNVKIPGEKILKEFAGSRNMISVSSCGLCGKTSFEDNTSAFRIHSQFILSPDMFDQMFNTMSEHQQAFRQSGGTHASAAFTSKGELLGVYEDIGRHNAVDKLLGGLIKSKAIEKANVVTVSGRISFEIVNKVLSAGVAVLASVSAPSTMAVNIANKTGMTLVAFCRNNKLTVYANPDRILLNESVQVNV